MKVRAVLESSLGEIYPPLRYGRAYFHFMDFLSHSALPPWQPSSSSGPCLSALPEQPLSLCSSSGPPASSPILTPFLRTHTGTHNMYARYITAYVHICSASMYIPPHLCTHILTCLHMHILTDTHTHTYLHVFMHACTQFQSCTCMSTHTCAYMFIHTHANMYAYVHIYMFVHMYTHIHTHAYISPREYSHACMHSYICSHT